PADAEIRPLADARRRELVVGSRRGLRRVLSRGRLRQRPPAFGRSLHRRRRRPARDATLDPPFDAVRLFSGVPGAAVLSLPASDLGEAGAPFPEKTPPRCRGCWTCPQATSHRTATGP